jgi:hypothetical protein
MMGASVIRLALIFICILGLTMQAHGDEFEREVRLLRKSTNAAEVERASFGVFLNIQRKFMAPAIKLQMSEDGQITSVEKIDAVLDRWQREYLKALPDLAFETHLKFYKENYSLAEMKELRSTLEKPLFQKYFGTGVNNHHLLANMLVRIQDTNGQILDRIFAEDPDWWVLQPGENQRATGGESSHVEKLADRWSHISDLVMQRDDLGWSLVDVSMAKKVQKYGAACQLDPFVADINELLPWMQQEKKAELDDLSSIAAEGAIGFQSDDGLIVQVSPQALLQIAILASEDWLGEAMDIEVTDDRGAPRCEKIRGWAMVLNEKAFDLRSLDN